jgi:hypothetical protein
MPGACPEGGAPTQLPHTAKKVRRRHADRKRRNAATITELTATAAAHGVSAPRDVGTLPEVLDEVLRRAVGHFRFAAAQVDELPADHAFTVSKDAHGNLVYKPHWWIEAERVAREEVADLALRMSGLDIDARRVAIAEAQAALMVRALQTAVESIGLTSEQRKALGPALRAARELLIGEPQDNDATQARDPRDSTVRPIEGTAELVPAPVPVKRASVRGVRRSRGDQTDPATTRSPAQPLAKKAGKS